MPGSRGAVDMDFPLTDGEIRSLFDAIHEREMASLRKQLAEVKKEYRSSLTFDIVPDLDRRG